MEDLFESFLNKLIINKTDNLKSTITNIKTIFNLKNKNLSENQRIKIAEKIYLISKQLHSINLELNDLLVDINNLNNIEIPNDISSKIIEEIEFKENIKELLPIYFYLFFLKLLEN